MCLHILKVFQDQGMELKGFVWFTIVFLVL
jgi:hypothetical protein